MKRILVVLLVLAVAAPVAVLAVSGCGKPTPEEARAKLETDLRSLGAALAELVNPTTYASKDSFDKAAATIEKSFNDVVSSAKQVTDIETTDLQDAWSGLKKAITSDQPLPDKLADIQVAAKNFQVAWQDMVKKLSTSK